MKIEFLDNEKCSLKDIKEGDCFMYENVLWVKTDYASKIESDTVLCVQMFNGHAEYFALNVMVNTVSSNVLKVKQ